MAGLDDAGAVEANPVVVEILRGDMVESRHRAAIAVVDVEGHVVVSVGDIERPVFARSAIKPLQALPLIETGAAEAEALTAIRSYQAECAAKKAARIAKRQEANKR